MPFGYCALRGLGEFAAFREASAHAKAQRAGDAQGAAGRVTVMFAENELIAEDQLGQVRESGPMPGDGD